jgi:hypothetical protein
MEPVMAGRITSKDVHLDATANRAVTKGIGEKLQQTLSPEQRFPDRLQRLLEAMDDREAEALDKTKGR